MGEWKWCRSIHVVNLGCLFIGLLGIWLTTENLTAVLFGVIGAINMTQSISTKAMASLKEQMDSDSAAEKAKD